MRNQRSSKRKRRIVSRLLAGVMSVAVFGSSLYVPGNMKTVYANEINEEESNDSDTSGPEVRSVNLNIDGKIAGIYNPTVPESLDSEWSNGTGCYIYFGKMARHRVLDSDTTDFSKDGEHTIFLFCEGSIDGGWYNPDNAPRYSQKKANEWKYSDPFLYLDGKYESHNNGYSGNGVEKVLNKVQQDAIIENYNSSHGDWEEVSGKFEYSELDGEKMFLLDAREIEHEEYGFSHTDAVSKSRAFVNGAGWLRSPFKDDDFKTGVTCRVDENFNVLDGAIDSDIIKYNSHCIYPAYNIKLSSIFFTSYREEDRMTLQEMHQACQAIPDLSYKPTVEKGKCNAWTVSIFDGNNDFTAERQDFGQVKPGDNVSVNIKSLGTAVEDVEYDQVSAMLVDESGTVLSYGMIKDISNGKNATGSTSVKIPDGTESGKYTLKIFAEDMLCEEVSRGQYSFPTGSMASNAVDIEIVVDSRDKTQIEVCNYDPSATYSGKAIANPTQEQISIEGAGYEDVAFEWFMDTVSDKTKIDTAPCDAGKYFLMATIPETETRRKSAFISSPIIISPKTVTPYITGSISKVYDGSDSIEGADNTLSVGLDGIIEGDDISVNAGSLRYADSEIGTKKTIIAENIEINGADRDNYILSSDTATAEIGVIGKIACPFNIPQSQIEAANTVKKAGDAVILPEGWEWEDGAGDTVIPAGGEVALTANYTADDSAHYETTSVEITITREACEESEVITDTEPDCTNKGCGHTVCTLCGDLIREDVEIDPLGHDWDSDYTVDSEADCTNDGSRSVHCKNCDSVKDVETVPAKGHSWDEGTVTTEPTCKTEGEKSFVCNACGDTKKEIISKTSHSASDPVHENEIQATCSEPGSYDEVGYCKSCGQEISRNKIETQALGHNLNKIAGKAATTAEEGCREHWQCDRCGKMFLEESADVEAGVEDVTIPKITPMTTPEPAHGGENGDNPSATPSTQPGSSQPGTTTNPPSGEDTAQTPEPSNGGEDTAPPSQGTENAGVDNQEDAGAGTGKETADTEHGQDDTENEEKPENGTQPEKGQRISDNSGNAVYTVLNVSGRTVEYAKPLNNKQKAVKIPSSIVVDGIRYKVTGIADGAFKGNKTITKIEIGNTIKVIGKNAFCGCKNLKSVAMGKNVTAIGEKAFYKCTLLTELTIPEKVGKIDKTAFYGCRKLKLITIKTKKLTSKNIGARAFAGIHKKAVVKVPASKKTAYRKLFKKRGLTGKNQIIK